MIFCPHCGDEVQTSLTDHQCARDNEDRVRQGRLDMDTQEEIQKGEIISTRRSW
jgi:uncharacterized membrane protein YvbJ